MGYFTRIKATKAILAASALSMSLQVTGAPPERVELEQGWTPEIREQFWFTSQGSQIMPYDWFLALEQPDNQSLFRDDSHFDMLGYLPMPASKLNPDALPVGFVKASDKDYPAGYVGMTCSACHTNQLDYKDTKFLIEGAPTLANFVLFFDRLVDSLNATYIDDAKFRRFAKRVLGDKDNQTNSDKLRSSLQEVALAATERRNVNALPEHYPENFTSYARLDAFGNIQNAGTAFALSDLNNRNTPDAPVSYPFLWGTHQSDVVQWNASAPNTPVIGPLVRNIGEVVGVFGKLSIEERPWWDIRRFFGLDFKYHSSVDITGLGMLESWVKTLKSPQWPANVLPGIDIDKAAKGEALYQAECSSCHQVIARADEYQRYDAIKTPVVEVGTDPLTAWNASCHEADSLILQGSKEKIIAGQKFAATTAAINVPVNGVVGMVLKDPVTALKAGLIAERVKTGDEAMLKSNEKSTEPTYSLDEETAKSLLEQHVQKRIALAPDSNSNKNKTRSEYANDACPNGLDGLVYKARPLNGIWATAPYLHNGSVPNLWQLMLKPEERVQKFSVGSREFDPVNVGYVTDEGPSVFRVTGPGGKIFPGNSNLGHDYGTHLTEQQKWQIVEYMKTL